MTTIFSYNVTRCYKTACNNNKYNAFESVLGKITDVICGSCNITKINSVLCDVTKLQMLLLNRAAYVTFSKVFGSSQRARVCIGTITQGYTNEQRRP